MEEPNDKTHILISTSQHTPFPHHPSDHPYHYYPTQSTTPIKDITPQDTTYPLKHQQCSSYHHQIASSAPSSSRHTHHHTSPHNMDTLTVLIIILTILVGAIGAFLLKPTDKVAQKRKRLAVGNNTILLTGDMNSGKTALFYALKTGRFVDTVTSLEPNKGTFPAEALQAANAGAKGWGYYDLPGHGSFASQLPLLLPSTKAVVFMIDATSMSSISTAAQSLYGLLTSQYLASRETPIVLTVNKTDSPQALPVDRIKMLLAQAVNQIYKANYGVKQLDEIGGAAEGEEDVMAKCELLVENPNNTKQFSFDELDNLNVNHLQWATISVKEADLQGLAEALAKA